MPDLRLDDTIAAIATPIGEGGISVIRVSGPDAFRIVDSAFRSPKAPSLKELPSHTIHLGQIKGLQGEPVDQVLVSLFRAPHSYTADDVIEISCHGGMVVTRNILENLIRQGARHAEPGEFTKRAFLNGKIDLMQAEAVLDLIKAKSDKSVEVAVRQLSGALSLKLKGIKDAMMRLYAHMEAFLDFPEDNLEIYQNTEMQNQLKQIQEELKTLAGSFKRGAMLREGLLAAFVGKPNVGKSSLFNALLEQDRALVSEIPGTTRDRIEEIIEIGGVAIRLIDTAGLFAGSDHPLDRMGMESTRKAIRESSFYLFVTDGAAALTDEDKKILSELDAEKPRIIVVNKSDLPEGIDREELRLLAGASQIVSTSCQTNTGLKELEQAIADFIQSGEFILAGEQITRLRHRNALESAGESLGRVSEGLEKKESLEFLAVDLKAALQQMQELIGEVYSEDLLDVVFSEFCIGK